MFTGLVEDVGTIAAVQGLPSGKGLRLGVSAGIFAAEVALGDSVCIDGVCLTAVAWHAGRADFEVGPETLARTTLAACRTGGAVNLERALRLGDRLGGHLVAGHVDGLGHIARVEARGEARDLRVAVPPDLMRYIVEKGSIAVDGISLTVNQVDKGGPGAAKTTTGFAVSLIPHTQGRTSLLRKRAGDAVNLEVDVIGKYVESLLSGYAPPGGGQGRSGLDLSKLKEHGFAPQE